VVVVPITSNITQIYPSEALIHIAKNQAKVMADQIMAADKSRLREKLGQVSPSDMKLIEQAICIHLGLPR
jgi:mRNA interferase MazF